MNKADPRVSMRGVFTFALIGAFALFSLLVVVIGARVYRGVASAADTSHETRTALAYIAGKIRASDESGMVRVNQSDGTSVLSLGGLYAGERYNTYIFCKNGSLCEYFAAANAAFSPEYGEAIAPANSFSAALDGGLITVCVQSANGASGSITLRLSAESEARP